MHQDILVTCYVYRKYFSVDHNLSRPQVGIVLAEHDNHEKSWAAHRAQSPTNIVTFNEPLINSSNAQEERTGDGSKRVGDTSGSGM